MIEEIWASTAAVCRQAMEHAKVSAEQIASIGITNQRETTVVWDKVTGQRFITRLFGRKTNRISVSETEVEGHESLISAKTGLLLDPYFSGTKLAWILDHVDGARARAERGELLFGTG